MKNKKNNFSEMSRKEKKEFLSNDLVERMIRLEQRISYHFRKPVLYNETEYYKSLNEAQRKRFEDYLKKNKRKKFLWALFLLSPLLIFLIAGQDFTGNVIREGIGEGNMGYLSYALVIMLALICIVFVIRILFKSRKSRRMNSHTEIVNKWLAGELKKSKS